MPAELITVTRRSRFAAARQVSSGALDAAGNHALFGRDTRLHGHDFTLHVTLGGVAAESTGMVMDLKALADLVRTEVVSSLDHTRLDGGELLAGLPATSENLAVAIWRRLAAALPPGLLREVELAEGELKSVRYRGE